MVLYFSGTGNSKYIAEKIAERSGDKIISIGERIKNNNYQAIKSDKPLVFVGPVYAGRYPGIMDDFIKKVEFDGIQQAYFIATCAATPWQTASYVKKMCTLKQFTLRGFNSVLMPQGYVAGGGTQPKEANDKVLANAEPKIEKIADLISKNEPLADEKPGNAVMSKLINPMMYMTMIKAKSFRYTDKCSGCGKCVERCPLNNIKLVGGKPVWDNNCTHCMACIAGCPNEAIEYGKKTVGKTRYYLGEK